MKKILFASLIIILLLATAAPAMAAGGRHGRGTGGNQHRSGNGLGVGIGEYFILTGGITDIDYELLTVTVYVVGGSPLSQPYRGDDITLTTDESTRFLQINADGTVTPISFDDLAPEQSVSAAVKCDNGTCFAARITVGADVIHYYP